MKLNIIFKLIKLTKAIDAVGDRYSYLLSKNSESSKRTFELESQVEFLNGSLDALSQATFAHSLLVFNVEKEHVN